ncbi:TFIIB-domain-containing protein [Calocera viscosa TUFC12733]|uniref:Transcription initiation factor IIB n=1 Tax=Calocera viscosa (strain TUFC12733) TaxID=1330018 RepID=A0A167NVS3_CALVF|nr:TFIIB-domain-containing protein [Calocera viscosa TUFC12733]
MTAIVAPYPVMTAGPVAKSQDFIPDLNVRLICPECKDPVPNIVEQYSSGDLVCGNCGMVLGDRIIDTRSEWRTFANEEGDDPSRVGAASDPLMDGMEQLDTVISFQDGGSGLARELQRASAKTQAFKDGKTMMEGFKKIAQFCDSISLPKVISDTAKQLYKRVEEDRILKGKRMDAIVAACIFIACRQGHVPRTFREICNITKVNKKALGQCYKAMEAYFRLNVSGGATSSTNRVDIHLAGSGSKASAEELIPRFCNHLGLPVSVERACVQVIVNAREQGINAGRSPISIAGGAIYFTTHLLGQPKHARDISKVANVSESTIKLVYKGFVAEKEKLVPKEWLDDGKAKWDRLPIETSK